VAENSDPNIDWETKCGHPLKIVAGVDEVGRGCLAGPVVAAAVVLPAEISFEANPWLLKVTDSKLLTAKKREELAPLISSWALYSDVAFASIEEIDSINIHHASQLAMRRALKKLNVGIDHVVIDGKFKLSGISCDSTAIVKGDRKCLSIACASILAKVWRDNLMVRLDEEYPGYDFAIHKGYPTPAHTEALKKRGVSPIHRRSFAPVAKLL